MADLSVEINQVNGVVTYTQTESNGNILVTEPSTIVFALPGGYKWPAVTSGTPPITITRTDNNENVTAQFSPTVSSNNRDLTITDTDVSAGDYWNYALYFTSNSGTPYQSDPRIYNRP